MDYSKIDLIELIKIAEKTANEIYDGHLTILRFTTGYKVAFGTPDIRTGMDDDFIYGMRSFNNLSDAIRHALIQKIDFYQTEPVK